MRAVIFLSAIIIAAAINIEYTSRFSTSFELITVSLLICDIIEFINKNK
jgi:hypothetical protein